MPIDKGSKIELNPEPSPVQMGDGSQNPIKYDAENSYNRETIANNKNGNNAEQTINGESN